VTKVIAILERDLKSYLSTFSFYLILAFFSVLTGYFFWSGMSYFSLLSFQAASSPTAEIIGLNLTEGVLAPFLGNVAVLLLLLIPILTMRSFSEERKLGTLELLVTYPVTDFQIVLGKFLAMVGILSILILPTMFYFLLAGLIGAKFELASLLISYLGLFLVGVSFLSLGLFVSSLTEQQSVSAGIGFVLLLFFWIVGWMAEWTSPTLGMIFRELSLTEHLKDLMRGIVDTKDLSFFILFSGTFLFGTLCALEVRNWKR